MVRVSVVAMLVVLLLWHAAAADEVAAPHVAVEYAGIDRPYAAAIAETLSAARQAYVDGFGFDMPDRVSGHVACGPDETTRLYTDGKDALFLSLKSKDDLAPPAKSGVFNLYGMCHELGHMAMYRTLKSRAWLTEAGAEGWAHWAGCVVVDAVYERKGAKLWPQAYDYRQDGTARLARALKAAKPSDVDRAAGSWQALDAILGHEGLPKAFQAWQDATVDPARATEALGKALSAAFPAKAAALEAWWKTAGPLVAEDRPASGFAQATIEPAKLSGKPIVLAGDDGTAESQRSIAGGGHARVFDAPAEGDAYLTGVRIFGARYGRPEAPTTTFEITLCDEDLKAIAAWTRPYSAFERGDMAWVRFDVPPTRVPKTFQVCLSFDPTATNGVYVGIDTGTHGGSRAALPGETAQPMDEGDWMIRAEVQQPKSTGGPLKSGSASPPMPAEKPAAERRLTVRVDPRVELTGIVFRLAGNPEYGQTLVPAYAKAVDEWFGKFADHAAVRHANALRREHGVSFDAVAGLAVHLDDQYRFRMPPEKAEQLDSRWPPGEATAFAEELRAFVAASDATAFLRSQAALFARTEKRLQTTLDAGLHLAWFDSFFGARAMATFSLYVSPLNGVGAYGPSVLLPGGKEELYSIVGVWATDASGDASFRDDVVPIVVHEFCHSYCNAIVDAHAEDFARPAADVWPLVSDAMASQAYGDAKTMMRESLVRACVVHYRAANDGAEAAARETEEQRQRSFLWTGDLATALTRYEGDRARYPTLDAFMPELAKAFAESAARAVAAAAAAPKVVRLVPENGAKDVDPALRAIVVTFDRPMLDKAWAVVGGGPRFPKLAGPPSYDATRKVLTIPVELQPGTAYELWLNRGQYDSFQSEGGVKLASVHVTFETRGT